jgi:hypothetical protein
MQFYRGTMRIRPTVLSFILCLVLCSFGQGQAETQGPTDPHRPFDPLEIDQQKKMEKARNEDRQKDLKRDTIKLLELATELKQYVDRTNESVLSLEVIHKSEEIEKLARNIKNKMKGQ